MGWTLNSRFPASPDVRNFAGGDTGARLGLPDQHVVDAIRHDAGVHFEVATFGGECRVRSLSKVAYPGVNDCLLTVPMAEKCFRIGGWQSSQHSEARGSHEQQPDSRNAENRAARARRKLRKKLGYNPPQ